MKTFSLLHMSPMHISEEVLFSFYHSGGNNWELIVDSCIVLSSDVSVEDLIKRAAAGEADEPLGKRALQKLTYMADYIDDGENWFEGIQDEENQFVVSVDSYEEFQKMVGL